MPLSNIIEIPENIELICEYGCGFLAKFKIGRKQKLCCSNHYSKCPENRKIRTELTKDALNTPELKKLFSENAKRINSIRWSDPEEKVRMSKKLKGLKRTKETCKRISKSKKGKMCGEKNHRYGKGNKGAKNGMYNKKHSTETRKLISINTRKGIDNMSPEEKLKAQQKRIEGTKRSSKNYSNISLELFKVLALLINREVHFKGNNEEVNFDNYLYDFTDLESKKIIEFNGDYWHANPRRYSEDSLVNHPGKKNLTAKEIWDKDQRKIEFAKSKGFDVLVIWESEFCDNYNETLNKCMEFLNGEEFKYTAAFNNTSFSTLTNTLNNLMKGLTNEINR